MRSVAVCLAGLLRALPQVGESIQKFLVGPLDADLFVSGPVDKALGQWISALSLFPSLQQLRLERENVTQFLHNAAGDGQGLRAAATIKGNWLGCLIGEAAAMRRHGSGLCQMYGQKQCLEMIVDSEQKRGQAYQHIVYSRPDLRWLGRPLPLSLLPEGESDLWIVDGEDNGGINDRHWVMPRDLAPELLGSWDRLIDGRAAALFLSQGLPELSTEISWSYFMANTGIYKRVRRIPAMAYVPCANHHTRKVHDTSARGWNDSGRLDDVAVRCELGGPKYRHEYSSAKHVADCKGDRQWSLALLWECWCAAKEDAKVLHYQEYRLCAHAQLAAAGWTGELAFIEEL